MKPGDEITVGGKVYVAADTKLMCQLMGLNPNRLGPICDYCTSACQIPEGDCIRNRYRQLNPHLLVTFCPTDDPAVYFFLKPEADDESD